MDAGFPAEGAGDLSVEADAVGILLERDKAAYGEEPTVRIPYDTIAEAHLVLTDDLIREALSKDNRARKEAKKHRGEADAAEETEAEK